MLYSSIGSNISARIGLEGRRFGTCPKDLVIFSAFRGRPNTVLNRRLPEITARRVLSIVPLEDRSPARCANKRKTR
jgi:hypothetical protein